MTFRVQLATNYHERMFSGGASYTDGEREAANNRELQEMLIAHGATEYHAWAGTERHRQEPVAGGGHDDQQDNSLDNLIREAQLAADLGTQFNPMLLLGRQFGVSGHQPAPFYDDYPEIPDEGPFSELTIDQISNQIRTYAATAAREVLASGVDVSVWDLGQEIDYGIAGVHPSPIPEEGEESLFGDDEDEEARPMFGRADWYPAPDGVDPEIGKMSSSKLEDARDGKAGAIEWLQKHVWPHQAQILASAAEGIRSVDPAAKVSSHITFYPDSLEAFAPAFWSAMWSGGYKPDQLGFTVFPSAAGAPWMRPGGPNATEGWAMQKATMCDLMADFGVPVTMTEFAYPCGMAAEGNFLFGWVYPVDGYPLTEDGQARFVEDTAAWAMSEGISGIRYWGVEWCFGDGDVEVWRDMAFFRPDGKIGVARPVIDAFAKALARV